MAKKKFHSGLGNAAGLPSNVIMKPYPKDGSIMPENMNDKLSGIDKQINSDKAGIRKQMRSPK